MKPMTITLAMALTLMTVSLGCGQMSNDPASAITSETMPGDPAAQYAVLSSTLDSIPAGTLSDAEASALLFMREEEKLAKDIYTAMETRYALRPFTNIKKSEQHHMDAVRFLIDRYQLADPVGVNGIGVFVDSSLQDLYNTLLAKGNVSAIEALTAAAMIEEVDIADLHHHTLAADNQDILYVFERLTMGSRNHLRAFVKNLSSRGVVYVPRYLSQEEYNTIIAGTMERGGQGWRGGR